MHMLFMVNVTMLVVTLIDMRLFSNRPAVRRQNLPDEDTALRYPAFTRVPGDASKFLSWGSSQEK